jgi:tetratricopeptide (TPR) repeat protein
MRTRPETLLILAMLAFALTGVAATFLDDVRLGAHDPVEVIPGLDPVSATSGIDPADAWFAAARPYCNPVEVESRLGRNAAPATERGTMNEAACYALAGKIDQARAAIERLPESRRYAAAGAVFAAGHPAADAGDNLAAGPLMELVIEYWPNHHMALYHAGTAAWERGDHPAAQRYLTDFLGEYAGEDGWRVNARAMLDEMAR